MPYWDRDLVEFLLQIPTHQLYRGARFKHVQRNAVRGLLPESVRLRTKGSLLMPLFERGLLQRERSLTRMLLEAPDAAWRQFIRPDWVDRAMRRDSGHSGLELVIIWQCVASELWLRQKDHLSGPPAGVDPPYCFDEEGLVNDSKHPSISGPEGTRDEESTRQPKRLPYRPPQLHVLGDVKGLVLGGSPTNVGDSQSPNTRAS
jgi:hypothetical protein